MTLKNFDEFFRAALGENFTPFDYQRRLAEDPECKSRLINIPIPRVRDKTAAVVLAWLWNRVYLPSLSSQQPVTPKSNGGGSAINSSAWPRRLAYCLQPFTALRGAVFRGILIQHELAGQHLEMATTPGGDETSAPLGSDSGGRGPEHGIRGRAGSGGGDPRDTRPDRATRWLETTRGILSYRELAPFLAERVAAAEAEIYRATFADRVLDETLLLDLHSRVCGDLVPNWAGRWRIEEVRVGNLHPPLPQFIPMQMREYDLDLQARWDAAAAEPSDLTLEFLAFAEGRFLTIHPFRDFNGRVIRLFLVELLRRLDLPRVILAPGSAPESAAYFSALEAADRRDWRPLMDVWRQRLSDAEIEES